MARRPRRPRRPLERARAQALSAWLLEQAEELCGRSKEHAVAYGHPGGHRTGNTPGRVMRGLSRYLEGCRHLRGCREACGPPVRARASLPNFRPWGPGAVRDDEGWRCPAERLNRHRYHDDWLHNLQVSASPGGYRR